MNQTLASAQQQRAKDDLLQRVLQRTAENKLLEPADDSAKFHLQRLVKLDAKFAGIPQAVTALGGRLTLDAQLARPKRTSTSRPAAGAGARNRLQRRCDRVRGSEARRRAQAAEPSPAAVPTPRIARMVRPEYPQDALVSRRGRLGQREHVGHARRQRARPASRTKAATARCSIAQRSRPCASGSTSRSPSADPHATRNADGARRIRMKSGSGSLDPTPEQARICYSLNVNQVTGALQAMRRSAFFSKRLRSAGRSRPAHLRVQPRGRRRRATGRAPRHLDARAQRAA